MTSDSEKSLQIHSLELRDLPEIVSLERNLFGNGAWSEDSLKNFILNKKVLAIGVRNDTIRAYLIARILCGEFELYRIGIQPTFQRSGLGNHLMEFLRVTFLDHLEQEGQKSGDGYLEVRASNKGAISFYHQLGFQQAGIRPNYYGATEDALVLKCRWSK